MHGLIKSLFTALEIEPEAVLRKQAKYTVLSEKQDRCLMKEKPVKWKKKRNPR